jgi:hypothetical protein
VAVADNWQLVSSLVIFLLFASYGGAVACVDQQGKESEITATESNLICWLKSCACLWT